MKSLSAPPSDPSSLVSLGTRMMVDPDSPPAEALGSIHELNCWIGVVMALGSRASVKQTLSFVQHDLRYLCDQITISETSLLSLEHIDRLDAAVECLMPDSGALERRVDLPGGAPPAAFSHVAHAVCRRAERRLASFLQHDTLFEGLGIRKERRDYGLAYLCRLSELLQAIARIESRQVGDSA